MLLCTNGDSFPFVAGKMFQAPDLNLIVEFIFMFYKEKPIDWLLDHILWVKVCNPEKDAVCTLVSASLDLTLNVPQHSSLFFLQKHCERQKSSLRIRFRPSLFQHVGLHSSLAGKIQKLTVRVLRPSPSYLFTVTFEAAPRELRYFFDFLFCLCTVGQRLPEATAAQDARQSPS